MPLGTNDRPVEGVLLVLAACLAFGSNGAFRSWATLGRGEPNTRATTSASLMRDNRVGLSTRSPDAPRRVARNRMDMEGMA